MTGKDVARLAAAVLLGAAVALPLGMMLGGSDAALTQCAPPASAENRAVYSPEVLSDPYFLEEQRKGIETLEQHCRDSGELCDEARQARRWLDGQGD